MLCCIPALFSEYGKEIRLWSQADSDAYEEEPYYQRITIYLTERGNAVMGDSEDDNSCLYDCLWYYLHDNLPWQSSYQMKKAINVKPDEKISIKHIPRLEQLLKNVSINITGDYTYTSTLNKKLVIDLILVDRVFPKEY